MRFRVLAKVLRTVRECCLVFNAWDFPVWKPASGPVDCGW